MDWTNFLLGAIAGIYFWNKLNPQVRKAICSLFSQEPLLFNTSNGASVGDDAEVKEKPHVISEYASVVTRAFNDGNTRREPSIPDDMRRSGSPVAQYLYDYLRGLMKKPPISQKTNMPPFPVTKPQ